MKQGVAAKNRNDGLEDQSDKTYTDSDTLVTATSFLLLLPSVIGQLPLLEADVLVQEFVALALT